MARPRVTLKLATSLDGRIATAAGESRWITGEDARAVVHQMRAAHDVVMIGAETARRDDPSLLARADPPPPEQPIRVVITNRLDIPLQGKLFEALDQSPLVVFARERANPAQHAILEGAGARVESVPALGEGLDLGVVLARLSERGVRDVLAEGGGRIAASLIDADLVDRLEWFRAPMVLGGAGKPAIADLSYGALGEAPRWTRVALRELGSDLWESYERAR